MAINVEANIRVALLFFRAAGAGTELGSYQNGDRFVDDGNGNVKSRPPETDLEVSLSSVDSAT